MNCITRMQRDVSFIPAVSCGSNSGTFASLPGFYIVPALTQKAFGCQYSKNLTQKSAAQLLQTGGSPGAQHVEVKVPLPSAFGHSGTLTGGPSRTALVSLEYICSWMSFAAATRKVLPLKVLQPVQDSSFPLITTDHYANSLGEKKKPQNPACTLTGCYVFIACNDEP